eukprot:7349258-Pyramimonas_sp.AAC.1
MSALALQAATLSPLRIPYPASYPYGFSHIVHLATLSSLLARRVAAGPAGGGHGVAGHAVGQLLRAPQHPLLLQELGRAAGQILAAGRGARCVLGASRCAPPEGTLLHTFDHFRTIAPVDHFRTWPRDDAQHALHERWGLLRRHSKVLIVDSTVSRH